MLIAERTLHLQRGDMKHAVPIRLFAPIAGDNSWGCRWEIHGPEQVRSGEAIGHDAVQALVLALQAIGSELYSSAAHVSADLRWSDAWAGYGFPVPGMMRDQLVGDDAKYL
ncbi:DUF6968 family protein [Rhodopseudomonas telluris]|uniref:DUF6968 family protein n=1 Tax=Rhodopseudomonas telluris TaxID=644215 RepID=A0ABV6EPJ8_9BRAD